MSRQTNFIGLTDRAEEFVKTLEMIEDSEHYTAGMFDEKVQLRKWLNTDGSILEEVVQAEPWSSGPCIFTCLQYEGNETGTHQMIGKQSHRWDQEDIDRHCG